MKFFDVKFSRRGAEDAEREFFMAEGWMDGCMANFCGVGIID